MAEPPPPPPAAAEVDPRPRTVQGMSITGQQVPKVYIHKREDVQVVEDGSTPVMRVPVINISLLSSSHIELENLYSALSSWGCFHVSVPAINHGISCSFLDELHAVTKQFFALPSQEKQQYSREEGEHDGYGNDAVLSENQILDWTDRLYLLVLPEDQRKLKHWPKNPPSLRKIIEEYSVRLQGLLEVLFKAMARSLKLDEKCFLDQYGEPGDMRIRFNLYPKCPCPDLVLGLKPHADGSAITVVLPDTEVEGLQFLKDEKWVGVPAIPHALLINVGDQLEIMSNGIFRSPVHRVITNSERERISVAVFCSPDIEKEIEPAKELINGTDRPRMYRSVKDYAKTYFEHYQNSRRPIDAARI